jgi:drug/metabolite transporter (DMT)-like permease
LDEFTGELAALSTALCWSFTSVFFTLGGSRVGSVVVNRTRLVLAVTFLSLTHLIIFGRLVPAGADPGRWFWLGLSGVIGLVIGDSMLFQAFITIGPRVSMLLMTLVPVISTVLAFLFFGESLSIREIIGIIIVISGISWVVNETNKNGDIVFHRSGKQVLHGVLLGIGGAMGQALGLITSKQGLMGHYPPLSANVIRMITAAAVMWIITLVSGRAVFTIRRLKDVRALGAITGGALCGPFIGVWLSLVAISYARIGIASTLMSLTPILIIPLSIWIFKDRVSIRAVFGTSIAFAGVVLLLLS